MENNKKDRILEINLLIFLAYSIILNVTGDVNLRIAYVGFGLLHAFIMIVLAIVNWIDSNTQSGLKYFLAMLIILVIGFSVCSIQF